MMWLNFCTFKAGGKSVMEPSRKSNLLGLMFPKLGGFLNEGHFSGVLIIRESYLEAHGTHEPVSTGLRTHV